MQSNNPVFRNAEGFGKAPSYNAYGNPTYAGNGAAHTGYGQEPPSQWSVGTPTTTTGGPMTIDGVVQKTAISLVVVILAAVATWLVTPDIAANADLTPLIAASVIGSGIAFVLSLVNSFKRVISPALVLAFAAAQGVALGALSKTFDAFFGHGLIVQAVIGTFAAFAGVLAAYKVFNIHVGQKFRTFVFAAMIGVVGLGLLEVVLGAFGASMGLFGFGSLGLIFAIVGLVLGVVMLILDFDFVEMGIRNRLPEREGWRAAFAMTVSLVWIYTNLLRLLAILQRG